MSESVRKVVDDAGEKIGGARKDYRRSAMTAADLISMTEAEQASLVKKDNIWPVPDYEQLVQDGMQPMTAALVKIMRDGMAAKPTVMRNADPLEAARHYVEMVGLVRDACLSCRTPQDARGVASAVQRSVGCLGQQASPDQRALLFSIYKGRYSPLSITGTDWSRASKMVDAGFGTAVPDWRKGVRAVAFAGTVVLMKGKQRLGRSFPSEDDAWEWLRASHAAKQEARQVAKAAPTPEEPVVPDRPHLQHIERSGRDVRGGRDVSPDDFLAEFGFRGVEFGLWLPNDERQAVLNMAFDAFYDLADVLELDPTDVSLGGTLAIAFGARGQGANAAHYEAGRRVLNLTRLRGAGSLAHEWIHGLDHFVGATACASPIENGGPSFASGYHTHTKSRAQALPGLEPSVVSKLDALLQAFRLSPKTAETAIADAQAALAAASARVSKAQIAKAAHLAAANAGTVRVDKKWIKETDSFITWWTEMVPTLEAKLARLTAGDPAQALGFQSSSFMEQAKALCGPTGEYWTRPTELLARAGESAIYDLLREQEMCSDYLVHSVDESLFASPMFKGNPYPTGDERRRYTEMFRSLVTDLRPLLTLPPEPVADMQKAIAQQNQAR